MHTLDAGFFLNIIFFLAVLDLCCCASFSVVSASRVYSLVLVHRLPIAGASLVGEPGL